jgi:prenyltransferase beta subunit
MMLGAIILATAVMAADDVQVQKQAAIAFLQKQQIPAGGFVDLPRNAAKKPQQPSLRTTRTALRALRLLGGVPADRAAVVRYLKACYDRPSGGFADRPGLPPDAISTAVGLMILGELKLPTKPYADAGLKFLNDHTQGFEQIRMAASAVEELGRRVPQADAWLGVIRAARNPDGSYGKGPGRARTTALYVVAQQRLGGKPQAEAAVLTVLRAGQRPDGGFGGDMPGRSDQEACYRIVRLFSRLGAQPDQPAALRAFIARCRNADGGYGVRPGQTSSLHGTYYATIVRYWLDGGK